MSRRIVWIDGKGVASASESLVVMFNMPPKVGQPVVVGFSAGDQVGIPLAAWSCGSIHASVVAIVFLTTNRMHRDDIMVDGALVAEYIGGGSEWPRKIPKE